MKNGTVAAIYSKSLRLRSIGGVNEESVSSGQVVNLSTNDAERFVLAALFVPYVYWGPILAISVLLTGFYVLGPAFAAGYLMLFFTIPLQFYLGKQFAVLRSKVSHIHSIIIRKLFFYLMLSFFRICRKRRLHL